MTMPETGRMRHLLLFLQEGLAVDISAGPGSDSGSGHLSLTLADIVNMGIAGVCVGRFCPVILRGRTPVLLLVGCVRLISHGA